MSTDIVRGDDELAWWLNQGNPNSVMEIIIAYRLQTEKCPICGDKHPEFSFKSMLDHLHYSHLIIPDDWPDTLKSEEIMDIIRDRYVAINKDMLNRSIAMLQVLVKYEANSGHHRNKHENFKKRAESTYRLTKEFLLTTKQIMELLDIMTDTTARRLLDTGLDEYYGDKKNYPIWMQNALTNASHELKTTRNK